MIVPDLRNHGRSPHSETMSYPAMGLDLAELIDDPFKYDSHKFRTEHEVLENEIAAFLKKFREVKKETFAVSEQVIEKEVKRLNP